jgi:hypothetical protein
VLLDLGRELSDLGVDDVRRITHHEVELFSPLHEGVEEVAMEERDALVDAVGGRVLPRDRECCRGGVDREKRGLGALASDGDGDAAAPASDVGDPRRARGTGGKLGQGFVHDALRFGARNEDRWGYAKREAVELLRSQDVLDGDAASPPLQQMEVVPHGLRPRGLVETGEERLSRAAERVAEEKLGFESRLGHPGLPELGGASLQQSMGAQGGAGRHDWTAASASLSFSV